MLHPAFQEKEKSFISNTLANSISSSGKKVVLIDADLKNPQISSDYNSDGVAGLFDFLENKILPQQIIQKSDTKNLYIIPAGTSKINSTELLLSGKLEDLMTYLEENFDHIIFDSPSVNVATDAYILSDACDSTIYLVRHLYTPKIFIKKLDDNLRIKTLGKIVLVYNDLKPRGIFKQKTTANWANVRNKATKKNKKLIEKRAII